VSLYGDAIRALRQVILLDERVRNMASDVTRLSHEVVDLRDRVSRIEGMLAATMGQVAANLPVHHHRLPGPEPSDQAG
jgi:hypothetical protein